MVFENILAQVLNRFLGAYVENLDKNQLNVGIWGGDVELKNLVLKQSALDDLDLPVQTIYGRIGKLVLKIPWKNLYGSAFVINIEDIYCLAAPNIQVKYDASKEEKRQIDNKKKEILKVEMAKKQEADKDKPKTDYTFAEKLITQIINNIQLNIKNIHIRYEDKITSPTPFSLGITLSDLDVVSTDETWKPAITKENISKIFKIVQLEGLAVYWNCNSVSYENLTRPDLLEMLKKEIASKNNVPSNYAYILGPINSSARLRINQKPELDTPAFSIPKIHLNLDLEKLYIGITKSQYRDILALSDSMTIMTNGIPYRQYRPDVPSYKGYYKEWWKFAYKCVLENEVRRKRRNWDWNHILGHRTLCKQYGKLYQKKLQNSTNNDENATIEKCEKDLDVFNIVLIRQRIELETERRERLSVGAKKSWSGWLWGSKPKEQAGSEGAILKQFEEAMTKEEKARLFKAIDYQENAAPAQYPETYIDNSCTFILRTLEVELLDDLANVKRVLCTELSGVKCRLDTRLAANSIKVHVKIEELTTYGIQQDTFIPRMITSERGEGDNALLEVSFETNPLDKKCGQRLHLTSQPLKVVYDAQTIIKIVDVFKIPSDTKEALSAAAGSGLMNIKEMSSTGLQHAIDSHVYLDLKIDFRAPYIIIPYDGKYTENENVLVINLGELKIYSLERPERKDVRRMHAEGVNEKEILKQMIAQSYDRFELELTNIQVMIAQSNEDWKTYISEATSTKMHILEPISLKVTFAKCMITDDPRLPLTQISGNLPSVVFNVSDARLLLLIALGTSIPLPTSDLPPSGPLTKEPKKSSSMVMLKYLEMQENAKKTKELLPHIEEKKDTLVQFTTVDIHFVMSELSFNLRHQEDLDSPLQDVASFTARSLEFDLIQQTYTTKISLRLASIGLLHYYQNKPISVMGSPDVEKGTYLFEVKFTQVNKNSPEFHSLYKSCESCLMLEFAKLNIVLHKESLLDLMKFATNLQCDVEEITGDQKYLADREATTQSSTGLKRQLSAIGEGLGAQSQLAVQEHKTRKKKDVVVETIKFKLTGSLKELSVQFTCEKAPISSCALQGIRGEIMIKSSYTQINANLNQIVVIDLNPESVHSTILSVTGTEALAARIVLYNLDKDVESDKNDLSVDLTMGGLKIIFLNWFVSRMMEFLNDFQAAQDAVIEASQAAAKTARENVQNAYAKATKLALRIDLKAPDIIIPANSKSYDAILLDMGHISICNNFMVLDIKNEKNFSAVIDEMKMNLDDFKLSRVQLNEKSNVVKELTLLVPVTFKLLIKRNLTSSWYNAVPDIDISGRIVAIKLLLTQQDYKTAMAIVNGNLAEGETPPPRKTDTDKQTVSQTPKEISVKADVSLTEAVHGETSLQNIEMKSHTKFRFTFTMDTLVVTLFLGGSKAIFPESESREKNALARFSLEGISLKVRILTDDSMIMSFLLIDCLLDDMRKGREDKLNRFIHRSADQVSKVEIDSTDSTVPLKSMIDVVFQKTGNHMFADVRVYSFTLVLSVDFLLKVADFFALEEEDTKKPIPAKPIHSKTSTTKSKTNVPIEPSETHMTVNLKIEKPDIILVEHMDNIDTKALMLNSEILIKLRISGKHQVINGSINDLQLYTCAYNPNRRAETRSNILHPVTISLAGSTPDDKGLHLELLVTDIRLSVSPATIELLSRVAATATGSGTAATDEEEEMKDYSDVWEIKPFNEEDYWFFRGEEAAEAIEALNEAASAPPYSQEMCIISMPSIILTLEAGVGNKTLPMLILESSFRGGINNWSTQMNVDASLTLQMSYYNSRLALWEPLIEPVEVQKNNKSTFAPWELKLEVAMNEQEEAISPVENESIETTSLQHPVMSIDIISEHSLELTVTKTCLEILSNLGKAFASAMKPGQITTVDNLAPFKVVNSLGCSVTVKLERGSFALFQSESTQKIILESGAEVPLQKKPMVASSSVYIGMQLASETLEKKSHFLNIFVDDKNCDLELPVVRADKRFFPLNYRGEGNDSWGLISDVKVDEGVTIITLRSILQVYNHFHIPVEVYYMTARGNELASITTAGPNSVVNIPLHSVYTPTNELFFSIPGYSVTTTPFVWKDLQTNVVVAKTLRCSPKDFEYQKEPFIIQAVGEMEQVYFENTCRHTMSSTCYNIHLRPAVVFKNCLPIDVICCVENTANEMKVEPGTTLFLPNVEPGKSVIIVRLPEYLEKDWSSRNEISENPNEFSVWTFESHDSAVKMSLDLGMHVVIKKGSVVMTLYCPFWMLNKTGLMLTYRTDDAVNILHHPANFKGPVLFSFNAKNFFGKKKAAIRIDQGEWSDKFSLDVAGSSGVVVCKHDGKIYQIGVHNQLTYNGLTKQVMFTPYYVIINNCPFALECQESERTADPWILVEPTSCSALWPCSNKDDKLLRIRVRGTKEESPAFLYTESHTSLVKLNNRYGGINVDIQMTEGSVYISLAPFDAGKAPALIMNYTEDTMNFWEKESIQVRNLPSKKCMLYTWENPSGPRILMWESGHKKEQSNDLRKDGIGNYTVKENYTIYWVSFLDGMQRVLLFTHDKDVAENAQAANLFEVIQQEITVSIHSVGLSLVNNINRQEILYMGIASSGIIWEQCKMNGKRFKHVSNKESIALEAAYQRYLEAVDNFSTEAMTKTYVDSKMEVDFQLAMMIKPHKRRIRRTFQTGLWVQIKSSPSQLQLHAKINRLQIDNQMYDCIFPVVLAPVPPPKSVAIDSGIKPFAELSVVQLLMKNSQVKQFKYCKLLIQEFHVKVDLGFINALVDVFQSSEYTEQEEQQYFLKDKSLVDEPLYAHVSTQSLQEQKSFYDLLHFSPLKIHVSFSMAAGGTAGDTASTPNFLNVLLQGLGVTLTDLQDVVFKLAYFEREYTFLTQKQLISEASSHYIGQSIKQLYVLVLGLDVIGNPYGLVLGITKGVEDLFYEPFQGAIQGPGEFAEGLVLGVRSLFGHTVGGAAGAVSRITGAMGKGIAALTFDKDFQRKRRDQANKKPATVQEGIARSGKGLVMGVVDGVTGVFTKPITGAKEEGVGGFFKGLGKGAVGLVARPTAGVVDFASGSLDAVKRVTEFTEEITRLRPPRFLQGDGQVRPYNKHEAHGHKLLMELEKGKYATTDIYVAHYPIIEKKEILLLSDKRLAFITHNDIFGGWQIDWAYTWQEIKHPPSVVPKGVAISLSEGKKKKLHLFGSSDTGKIVLVGDPQKREEICEKIESLRGNA